MQGAKYLPGKQFWFALEHCLSHSLTLLQKFLRDQVPFHPLPCLGVDVYVFLNFVEPHKFGNTKAD